jgi:hypothetical protein
MARQKRLSPPMGLPPPARPTHEAERSRWASSTWYCTRYEVQTQRRGALGQAKRHGHGPRARLRRPSESTACHSKSKAPWRGSASDGHCIRSLDRRNVHCMTPMPHEFARSIIVVPALALPAALRAHGFRRACLAGLPAPELPLFQGYHKRTDSAKPHLP